MNWEMLGTLMTVVGIPALGALWGLIEHRRSKRDEVQHRFNELILTHMDKTGKVLTLNAEIALGNSASETHEDLEKAVKDYKEFREGVYAFEREQTLAALRTKKGG